MKRYHKVQEDLKRHIKLEPEIPTLRSLELRSAEVKHTAMVSGVGG